MRAMWMCAEARPPEGRMKQVSSGRRAVSWGWGDGEGSRVIIIDFQENDDDVRNIWICTYLIDRHLEGKRVFRVECNASDFVGCAAVCRSCDACADVEQATLDLFSMRGRRIGSIDFRFESEKRWNAE